MKNLSNNQPDQLINEKFQTSLMNDANILTDNEAFDPNTGSTGLKSALCKVRDADVGAS